MGVQAPKKDMKVSFDIWIERKNSHLAIQTTVVSVTTMVGVVREEGILVVGIFASVLLTAFVEERIDNDEVPKVVKPKTKDYKKGLRLEVRGVTSQEGT